MPEPLVCAILLTKDRPAMAKRVVVCFRKQTYQNKRLYIYDTGTTPCTDSLPEGFPDHHIVYHRGLVGEVVTIGMLRNRANWWGVRPNAISEPDADILIHWDDDDYSHPNRIAEQVSLLQASGKQCVGYRDMLFWREHPFMGEEFAGFEITTHLHDETWLYTNNDPRYCLGTSLCYWRSAWERRPFPDISRGEDKAWLREVESKGISSLATNSMTEQLTGIPTPRMIASIHSGNHVVYEPEKSPHNFKRVPEWNAYAREKMSL